MTKCRTDGALWYGGRKLLIEGGRVLWQRTIRGLLISLAWVRLSFAVLSLAGLTAAAARLFSAQGLFYVSEVVDVRVCCRCSGGRARCWPHNMHKLRAMQVSVHISPIHCGLIISLFVSLPLDDFLIDTISAAQREKLLLLIGASFENNYWYSTNL